MGEAAPFEHCLDRIFTMESRRQFLIDELQELGEDLRETEHGDIERLIFAQFQRVLELLSHRPHPNTPEAQFALHTLSKRYFLTQDEAMSAMRYMHEQGLVTEAKPLIQHGQAMLYFLLSTRDQVVPQTDKFYSRGEILPSVLPQMRQDYYRALLHGFVQVSPQAMLDHSDVPV